MSNTFNPDDFWEKRLSRIKGLEGVGYAKLGKTFNYWAYKIRKRAFQNIIKQIDTHKSSALDIGSGTGFYVDLWHRAGVKKVTGIDITETAVENLKRIFPEDNFLKADIGSKENEIATQTGTYELVSCMDVLFHIVDDERFRQALINIGRLTAKNGYFIYSDNFLNGNTWRTKHQVSHTRTDLYQWIKDAGFEVMDHRAFMVISNYPLDTRNVLLKAYWWVVENTLAFIPFTGYLLGPLLYFIDSLLLNKVKDSPSSEIVLLRKVS